MVGLQADRTLLSMDDTRLLSLGRRLRTRPTVPKINVLKHKVGALEPKQRKIVNSVLDPVRWTQIRIRIWNSDYRKALGIQK